MTTIRTAAALLAPAAVPPADLVATARWVAQSPDPVAVELSCAEHPDPGPGTAADHTAIRLRSCLAEVPTYAVLEVLSAGAPTVRLRLDGCLTPDPERWQLPVPRLVVVAAAPPADRAGRLRRPRVLDAGALPVPRRALLALDRPEPAAEGGTAHQRLADALRELAPPDASAWEQPGTALRLLAPDCTACGVCVRACPDQALSLDVDPTRALLVQQPALCSGCGDCVRCCPIDAVVPTGRHPWSVLRRTDSVVVAQVATSTCLRCGTAFPDDGTDWCPPCAFRRANPFGSILPAELGRRTGPADRDPPG